MAKVICPARCHEDKGARVIGTTIHPKTSTPCASAIADGIVPAEGGSLVLQEIKNGYPSYTGKAIIGGITAAESGANITEEA